MQKLLITRIQCLKSYAGIFAQALSAVACGTCRPDRISFVAAVCHPIIQVTLSLLRINFSRNTDKQKEHCFVLVAYPSKNVWISRIWWISYRERCECMRSQSLDFLRKLFRSWTDAFCKLQNLFNRDDKTTFALITVPFLAMSDENPDSFLSKGQVLLNRCFIDYSILSHISIRYEKAGQKKPFYAYIFQWLQIRMIKIRQAMFCRVFLHLFTLTQNPSA